MLVQFGNNWTQKSRTAKLDWAAILVVLEIFFIQLFPNLTACIAAFSFSGIGYFLVK